MMAVLGCTAEDAWDLLVTVSQHHNIKLRDVAAAVTADFSGYQPMPPELRQHLHQAVDVWRSRKAV